MSIYRNALTGLRHPGAKNETLSCIFSNKQTKNEMILNKPQKPQSRNTKQPSAEQDQDWLLSESGVKAGNQTRSPFKTLKLVCLRPDSETPPTPTPSFWLAKNTMIHCKQNETLARTNSTPSPSANSYTNTHTRTHKFRSASIPSTNPITSKPSLPNQVLQTALKGVGRVYLKSIIHVKQGWRH